MAPLHASRSKSGSFITKKEAERRKNSIDGTKAKFKKYEPSFVPQRSGRRIVDLDVLGNELWCSTCDKPLSIGHRISETRSGLNSCFEVLCVICNGVRKVNTSRSRNELPLGVGGRELFDVNFKVAIAIIDAGIGTQQLNSLLSALNIPEVSAALMKRHERRVGPMIETVAKDTCLKMAVIERELSVIHPVKEGCSLEDRNVLYPIFEETFVSYAAIADQRQEESPLRSCEPVTDSLGHCMETPNTFSSSQDVNDNTPSVIVSPTPTCDTTVPIAVSFDAGWQMRGNGRSYNSQSGHGALMGYHTRKVIDYATRCRICRKCQKNVPKDQHDCRCNFSGSAKAMEPDMAVQLVAHSDVLKEADVKVAILVGDDDSSTVAALRRDGAEDIEKVSDLTHCKKNLGNALYKLQSTHRALTPPVIKYIQRCFAYSVEQNKNSPTMVKKALLNVTDHIFGKHSGCGNWCGFREDPERRYACLPRGECLRGEEFEAAVRKIFAKYADHANKLAPCASTQCNESVNSVIASKNPKSKFYSGSESNDYRVAAAVSQVNIGTQYVVEVNARLGLSPGDNTVSFKRRMDMRRKLAKARQNNPAIKRRRLFLKTKNSGTAKRKERQEGTSYESGMGMQGSAVPRVPPVVLPQCDTGLYKLAYFDLETSGFTSSSSVVQIAALVDNQEYSAYIRPEFIPEKVTNVTGLRVVGGGLYLNDDLVSTVTKETAWQGLINFLAQFNVPIMLIGHNIAFDLRFTFCELEMLALRPHFEGLVHGSIDTVNLLKKILPGKSSYKQDAIAMELQALDSEFQAHNAVGDVRALRNIVGKLGIADDIVKSFFCSFAEYKKRKQQLAATKANAKTLEIFKNCLSKVIVNKIARITDYSGLKEILKDGDDALKKFFSENCNGSPRITKNKKILATVLEVMRASS